MNTLKQAYIAIDLHRKNSVIGHTNQEGKRMNLRQVQTSPQNLINQLAGIDAQVKHLTIEQTNMTFAMAQKLHPYVDKLIICEPRHNTLISQSSNKNDRTDTINLCKLLRLGELKPVWRPKKMGKRRLLYQQVKAYRRLSKMLTTNKNQLQASLPHWGIYDQVTSRTYKEPEVLFKPIDDSALQEELTAKVSFIQQIETHKSKQLARLRRTGSDYPEIKEFQKMTGIGPIGAHTFSGYI